MPPSKHGSGQACYKSPDVRLDGLTCGQCRAYARAKHRRAMSDPDYREHHRTRGRTYYETHRAETIARTRLNHALNREARLAQQREAYARRRAANPERMRAQEAIRERRRLMRKLGIAHEPYGRDAVFAKTRGRCYLCGTRLLSNDWHVDHVSPLSRGGADTLANVLPACAPCNQWKSSRLLLPASAQGGEPA